MSSHRYRTTTIEYYEYLMPDPVESIMFLPYNAANNYLVMPEENCYQQEQEVIGNVCHMVQWYQRPTFIQYESDHNECHCHHSLPNPGHEHEHEDEDERETVENVRQSSPAVSKPKSKQNHVYQAEQGYLVEEPASESSEEEEAEEEKKQDEGQANTSQTSNKND
ncbi:uncharacterized protein LOC133838193 [Drosophila sulfurigaster albostrigata]|uniref:uncharacterized protein LOC133838193 n=1 Tax=Drosophila sulfurigaster albostrigata TaxID=89887 RepID=UPI002D21A0E4|nr:uncharacterized protein LOC133838193 [Drosophila sulfurigaster albostrigata]